MVYSQVFFMVKAAKMTQSTLSDGKHDQNFREAVSIFIEHEDNAAW